jgi:hypothetical protein
VLAALAQHLQFQDLLLHMLVAVVVELIMVQLRRQGEVAEAVVVEKVA